MGQHPTKIHTQNHSQQITKPQQQLIKQKISVLTDHISGLIRFSSQFSCETPIIVKVKNGQKFYAQQDFNSPNFLTIVNKRASKSKKYLIEKDILKIMGKICQILAQMQAKAILYEGFNGTCNEGLQRILYCVNSQKKSETIKLIPNEIIRKKQQTSYQPIKQKNREFSQSCGYQQVMKNAAKILSCICLLKTQLYFSDFQLILKQIEKLYSLDIINIFRSMFSYNWDCIGFNQWVQKNIKKDNKESKIKAPSQILFKKENISPFKQNQKNKYIQKNLLKTHLNKSSSKSSSITTPIKQVKIDIETSAKKRSNQVYYNFQDTVKQNDNISAFCLLPNNKHIEKNQQQIATSEVVSRAKINQISNSSRSLQKNSSKYSYLNKNERKIQYLGQRNQELNGKYSPVFLKSLHLDRFQREKSVKEKFTKYQKINNPGTNGIHRDITHMYDVLDRQYESPFKTVKQVSARFEESAKFSNTLQQKLKNEEGFFKHQINIPNLKNTQNREIFKTSIEKLNKQVDKSKKLIANFSQEKPQNLIALAYKQNTQMLKSMNHQYQNMNENKNYIQMSFDQEEVQQENMQK